jgi:hypothetical protein
MEEMRHSHRTSAKAAAVTAETQTEHLMETCQKRYCQIYMPDPTISTEHMYT